MTPDILANVLLALAILAILAIRFVVGKRPRICAQCAGMGFLRFEEEGDVVSFKGRSLTLCPDCKGECER